MHVEIASIRGLSVYISQYTEREVLCESESVASGSAPHFEQLGRRGVQPHVRHLLQNHVS